LILIGFDGDGRIRIFDPLIKINNLQSIVDHIRPNSDKSAPAISIAGVANRRKPANHQRLFDEISAAGRVDGDRRAGFRSRSEFAFSVPNKGRLPLGNYHVDLRE